jgi:hypothetical protein
VQIKCKILESKQSDKFLFMKVQFTASSFFGLWNCSNVHWVYIELDRYGTGISGYSKTKDTNEYIFVKYGSSVESYLSKEADRLTKEHQKFKEHLENQFLTAK